MANCANSDHDTAQEEADARHIHNVIPSHDRKAKAKNGKQETGDMRQEDTSPDEGKIPEFDLADELMAEHRKATTGRRKPPGKKDKLPSEQLNAEGPRSAGTHQMPVSSEAEQVIAEIVARDINRLCKADSSIVQSQHVSDKYADRREG